MRRSGGIELTFARVGHGNKNRVKDDRAEREFIGVMGS